MALGSGQPPFRSSPLRGLVIASASGQIKKGRVQLFSQERNHPDGSSSSIPSIPEDGEEGDNHKKRALLQCVPPPQTQVLLKNVNSSLG
jgi:hypothetical protein